MEKGKADVWPVFCFHPSAGTAVTGAAITATLFSDGATSGAAVTNASPIEIGHGFYQFTITSAENNIMSQQILIPVTTGGTQCIAYPNPRFPRPENFNYLGIESDGDLTKVNTLDGHIPQTGDTYVELPTNLSDLVISTAGNANTDVKINSDKTGYTLSSGPLTSSEAATILSGGLTTYGAATSTNITAATSTITASIGSLSFATTGQAESIQANIAGLSFATTAQAETMQVNITSILDDTNELQTNQGNWLTATGFATSAQGEAIQALINALNNFDPATDIIARVTLVDTVTNNTDLVTAADIKAALEANNSDLDYLVTDLINKKSIKIATGISTQYDDSNTLIGSIPAGYSDDGVDVFRPRQVITKV